MHYRILAEAVMFVHFGFILFVAVGALLTWRWRRVAWVHVPALAWAVGTVTIGFPCPLTTLEKVLHHRAGGRSYEGGFIDQYLEDVIYPQEYTTSLRAVVAVMVLVGYLGQRQRSASTAMTRAGRQAKTFGRVTGRRRCPDASAHMRPALGVDRR